jgi:hypothetical protein
MSGQIVRQIVLAFSLVMFGAFNAQAAVSISKIEGASSFTNSHTAGLTIFGGTAGPDCSAHPNADGTCDNCSSQGGTGDASLFACNNNRITPSLNLKITLVSNTLAKGFPLVTNSSTGTETIVVNPGISVASGNAYTISIPWSTICSQTNYSGDASTCNPTDLSLTYGSEDYISLNVGLSADGKSLTSTGSESATITIRIRQNIGQVDANFEPTQTGLSLGGSCATENYGICFFQIGTAIDNIFVKTIQGQSGFPAYSNDQFKYVRFLYSTTGFADITPGSPHKDLLINQVGQTTNLSPMVILSGLGQAGQTRPTYYFKTAVIDSARNVGYYTMASEDTDCTNNLAPNPPVPNPPAPGTTCHISAPGAVTGPLFEPLVRSLSH